MIHPESLEIYKNWLSAGYQVKYFKAAAKASSRSLLAWQAGNEMNAFIAKVSLNKEVAGVVRTLRSAETTKSFGVFDTFEGTTQLPKSLLFPFRATVCFVWESSARLFTLGLAEFARFGRDLPKFTGSIEKDYSLNWYANNIRESLHNYFKGGFLFNVQEALIKSFSVVSAFCEELVNVLEKKTGRSVNLGKDYSLLEDIFLKMRL